MKCPQHDQPILLWREAQFDGGLILSSGVKQWLCGPCFMENIRTELSRPRVGRDHGKPRAFCWKCAEVYGHTHAVEMMAIPIIDDGKRRCWICIRCRRRGLRTIIGTTK